MPRNTAKSSFDFTNFLANMFLFGVRKKTFALHHFLTPKYFEISVHLPKRDIGIEIKVWRG